MSTEQATMDQEAYVGGEEPLLDPQVEADGVKAILDALTEEETALMPDPSMPIRYLRGEKGDVEKAVAKIRATLEWRKTFETDELVKAMTEDGKFKELMLRENDTGKVYVRGYDNLGHAVIYMRPQREQTNNEADNMKHLVWNLEKAIACTGRKSTEMGSKAPKEKIVMIQDYTGFSLSNAPPMSTSKLTIDILQNHYPERLYRAYVLNPPFVFTAFWSLVKPFLDPVTKAKVVFLTGSNPLQPLHNDVESLEKLEECAGGSASGDFDSKEYLNLPFDVSYGE